MLRRHDHRVDAARAGSLVVFHRDLRLAIRQDEVQNALLAHIRQTAGQVVRRCDGIGHEGVRLVAGIAKHHALVARADVEHALSAAFERVVHALRNVGRLPVDADEHTAVVRIKPRPAADIADAADGIARDFLHVHIAARRDFAHHEHDARVDRHIAGDARLLVLRQDRVQHAIGNLVADFIRMSFRHGFGSE